MQYAVQVELTQSERLRNRGGHKRPHWLLAVTTFSEINTVVVQVRSDATSCDNSSTSPTSLDSTHLCMGLYPRVMCLVTQFRAHPLISTRLAEPLADGDRSWVSCG